MATCGVFAIAEAPPPPWPRKELADFTVKLKAALAARKPEAVTMFIDFPLYVTRPHQPDKSFEKAEFLVSYDEIFTPKVIAEVMAQDPNAITPGPDGYQLANGAIWVFEARKTKTNTPATIHAKIVNVR